MNSPESVEQIEADFNGDPDSAFGDDTQSTESARSSLLQSMRENGRHYHSHNPGLYILPDDDREQERLDMQHVMCLRSLNGELHLAPLQHPVKEVLDLGTGTGIWALDFADKHDGANVEGVDLSAIQPGWVSPNCKFTVDNFDLPWTWTRKFDFIHGRMLITASDDFPRLFQQSFEALQPGGYFELQDVAMPLGCDDGTMEKTALEEWNNKFMEACLLRRRDPSWAKKYKDWMAEAGFQNVTERKFIWPINPWPKNRELKWFGRCNQVNMSDGIEGFSLRLFSSELNMEMAAIQVLLAQVRKDIENRNIHAYLQMYVVYGQKPPSHASELV